MRQDKYSRIKEALDPMLLETGAIIMLSQNMEFGVRYAISLLIALEKNNEDIHEFDEAFDSLTKKTLGYLITKIKTHIDFDEQSEKILKESLDARNFAVHHFYTDNLESLATPLGRIHGKEKLQEIHAKMLIGSTVIHVIVEKLMKLNKIDGLYLSEKAFNDIIV